MYSATLLDHFNNPRNTGDLPGANVRARVENPVCGDILELAALVVAGKIEEIRFRAKGCVPTVACASRLTELLKGQMIGEVAVTTDELVESLGGIPQASNHAAQLTVEAFRNARREALGLMQTAQHA